MATIDVYNENREKTGEVSVDDSVFGSKIKEHLFYDVIRMQMANRYPKTASVKGRSDVRGGGKKPWRQKGTGRARAGTSRSPIWKGGGVVFGPVPGDRSIKVPKKVRKQALCSALSMKIKDNSFIVVEDIDFAEIRTKRFIEFLANIKVSDALIIEEENLNLVLSARNVPGVKILPPEGLNLYDILNHSSIIITKPCLEKVQRRLLT